MLWVVVPCNATQLLDGHGTTMRGSKRKIVKNLLQEKLHVHWKYDGLLQKYIVFEKMVKKATPPFGSATK